MTRQEASASLDIYEVQEASASLDIYEVQEASASMDIYGKYRKLLHHWISMTNAGSFCITGYL